MGSLYRSKHELAFIAKKGKAPHTNNVQLGRHGRYRTNVWDYVGVNSVGRNRDADLADHRTVKPLALVADTIRDVTKPGDLMIDGFMGSGTTILAAEGTKGVAAGIDIKPGYVDVAIRLLAVLTPSACIEAVILSIMQIPKRFAILPCDVGLSGQVNER
jgi:DNA modification methylase